MSIMPASPRAPTAVMNAATSNGCASPLGFHGSLSAATSTSATTGAATSAAAVA